MKIDGARKSQTRLKCTSNHVSTFSLSFRRDEVLSTVSICLASPPWPRVTVTIVGGRRSGQPGGSNSKGEKNSLLLVTGMPKAKTLVGFSFVSPREERYLFEEG
jgi:hypothetical protein